MADNKYDPLVLEPEILKFWEKKKIFKKLQKKLAKSKKQFSFLDGPITANNPMGVHHAWGRTYKDLFLRFKAMQGCNQRWINGFDCQGLWVEREEEKDLGLKSKEDIEKFGILNFVKACKARVLKFANMMTEDSIRLGQWMNWDDSYYTMSDDNNLHNWFLLKEYHKKGWLYKGEDAVPWCPRCGTAVSKHDILTEGYFELTEPAITMKFPVIGKEKEYLLVWTTTPWTVAADVAVAVHPNKYYVKVKQSDEYFWLIETRTDMLKGKFEIVQKVIGSDLIRLNYEMPYKNLPAQRKAGATHPVVGWDLVSDEEGTGIVHIAPGCGPEDYELGKAERLPAISPLNEAGIYTEGYNWLSGLSAFEADPKVIEDLKKRDFIYKVENYKHRYPHCWRCKTKLIFRLVPEWYIRADEIRPKLKEENQKIYWHPEYGKSRQETWFNTMGDWMISQKRYWGLPLPFWECSCGHFEVIGSLKELKQKAVKGMMQLKEIHKPWIDKVIIKCPKCGKNVSRIADIGITWLDAGITPFSTIGPYLKNKKYWEKWYPADFISENMPGQYRGWFNAIMWAGVAIAGKAPFKSILGYETLKDEKGREMHKSLGNAILAREALAKIGADPLRLKYCLQDPTEELWFGWSTCEETKRFINILWNLHQLILKSGEFKTKLPAKINVEDKWIISKLHSLIENCTKELEALHPHTATNLLKEFWTEDLSRNYIHFIRERLAEKDEAALSVLYYVYSELLKLLAPAVPFVTEVIYQNLRKEYGLKEESIHLLDWPKADNKLIDKKLEAEINYVKDITSSVLALREKIGRSVRWPIKTVSIVTVDEAIKLASEKHSDLIKRLANVLEISSTGKSPVLKQKIKADFGKIDPKYGRNAVEVVRLITEQSPESLTRKLQKDKKIIFKLGSGEQAEITRNELIIEETLPKGLAGMQLDSYSIYLDLEETLEMFASGCARETVRKIQDLRKKAGLQKPDKISLAISTDNELERALRSKIDEIKKVVGAQVLEFEDIRSKSWKDSFKIRDKKVDIGFNAV